MEDGRWKTEDERGKNKEVTINHYQQSTTNN
jgi:hypothetical protein